MGIKGYTPLPNSVYEALSSSNLASLQLRAILYLWRTTYGYRQKGERLKSRDIQFPEWIEHLNADKSDISRALKDLEERKIIIRQYHGKGKGYTEYQLNINTLEWCRS